MVILTHCFVLLYHKKEEKSIDKRQKPTNISQYDTIYFDYFIIAICQLVVTKIHHSSRFFFAFSISIFYPWGLLKTPIFYGIMFTTKTPRSRTYGSCEAEKRGTDRGHWAASNCVLTTILTIYRFGLRGNYGLRGTKKHGFRTKKHRKARKMRQKTDAFAFGS